jgi:hypothetical protein
MNNMAKTRSNAANSQRANVKNPNNAAFKAAQDNKADQLNPNHSATKGNNSK